MSDAPRVPELPAFVSRWPGPLRAFAEIMNRTLDEFLEDGGPRLAAALAYYLLIALAPLLIVIVTLAGMLFEQAEVRNSLISAAYTVFGEAGATVVNQILLQITSPAGSPATTTAIIGGLVALFGASAAFSQLQAALNIVWGIRPRPESFGHMVRRRGLTFLAVVIIGALLVAMLVLSTGLARLLATWVPSFEGLTFLTQNGLSFFGAAWLFGILFTVLPDRRIEWRDTVVGALVTSLLFNVGSIALGAYIGRSGVASFYGAAGSVAVVLVWLYYSTQVLLFGAEFTHVWSARRRAQDVERSQESSGEA